MSGFVDDVRAAVTAGLYYPALATALSLPDICADLGLNGRPTTQSDYVVWWEQNMQPKYDVTSGVGISGRDAYALRCSFLHNGSGDISAQRAKEILDDFVLVMPSADGNRFHLNRFNKSLILMVDELCLDICDAVEAWHANVTSDPDYERWAGGLLAIVDTTDGYSFG